MIADASQIECRILNFVAGQMDVVEAFEAGRDIYCERATGIYRRTITPEDKNERFVAKRTELSSGYGCGHVTLRTAVKGDGLTISFELAASAIKTYRATHPQVVLMWRECDVILHALAQKKERQEWRGGIIVTEGNDLTLPNGLKLHYDICYDAVTDGFVRQDSDDRLWGGVLTGHIIQALAACYFREVLLKIKADCSLMPVCLRHDEAVYVVPKADASQAMAAIDAAFKVAPAWLPGIPLKCECLVSKTYSKA